ncbi:MAG: S-layer homology domain-containing protein, partial [Firmicutes bacterium]|nr:S-layer homology domain-containing protein [Bacillota bacterium]
DVTNVFTDVSDNAWYVEYLQNAYDNRIVGGTSADKYTPDGSLTHAQIMVMVANLHSLQKGDNYDFQANKKAGDAWYQVFEDYCIAEGIIPAETFTDPDLFKGQENASVNRGQMAFYFAHALTEDAYLDKKAAALSDIGGHVFAADIEKLAKANIVGGYEDGTFRPAALVTRAEASVFVSNILDAIE